MLNKKAAMFGLDARIALAIFGALSVISGAALYGVLEKVERTRTIHALNEFTKSVESYLIDTTGIYHAFQHIHGEQIRDILKILLYLLKTGKDLILIMIL